MSEPKFTPGPWSTEDREITGPIGVSVARAGIAAIATGRRGSYSIRESEAIANSHLIAASPELFEALQKLIAVAAPNLYPTPDKPNSPWGVLEQARAAVRKALGEPQ